MPEMVDALLAAGITRYGRARPAGVVDAHGRDVMDHALIVKATDAEQAYGRVQEILGAQDGEIRENPTRLQR